MQQAHYRNITARSGPANTRERQIPAGRKVATFHHAQGIVAHHHRHRPPSSAPRQPRLPNPPPHHSHWQSVKKTETETTNMASAVAIGAGVAVAAFLVRTLLFLCKSISFAFLHLPYLPHPPHLSHLPPSQISPLTPGEKKTGQSRAGSLAAVARRRGRARQGLLQGRLRAAHEPA